MLARKALAATAAASGAWDISTIKADPKFAWDISKTFYYSTTMRYFVQTNTGDTYGLYVSPDGTKFYTSGRSIIVQYSLSIPWKLSSGSHVATLNISAKDTGANNMFFKPDGTKMYFVGDQNDKVYEYDLSTAWSISTATFSQEFSVSSQETTPTGLYFKPDGTKMYICGTVGDDVNEYTLSTAWDISTATYIQNFSVATEEATPNAVHFSSDGTNMYITGSSSDQIRRYALSSAWDISTASLSQSLSIASPEGGSTGVFFKDDGTFLFFTGFITDYVYSYSIVNNISVSTQDTVPTALFFKPDGTKLYVLGDGGNDVNEYDLSTAWDVSTATYLQNFLVETQEGAPNGLYFKPDGTKMYMHGTGGDDVNEYSLSTPWDISTASYVQVYGYGARAGLPYGLHFKPDGTKFYVTSGGVGGVLEYTMSTAWDVSTASFTQESPSVAANSRTGVFFKDDGTKMYVSSAGGTTVSGIYEYDVATPWDVSTISYSGFNALANNAEPQDLFFKDDGTQLFIVDSLIDRVVAYTLGS